MPRPMRRAEVAVLPSFFLKKAMSVGEPGAAGQFLPASGAFKTAFSARENLASRIKKNRFFKMTQKYSSFSYKAGKSFVHRMPAWLKLLFVPVLSVAAFQLPLPFDIVLIFFQLVLAFSLGFSVKEQFNDLKFVLYFAVLLYLMGFAGFFCSDFFGSVLAGNGAGQNLELGFQEIEIISLLKSSFLKAFSNSATALMLVRLFCVMQTSSIIFKTTTSLEIREGVGKIESAVRKALHLKDRNALTDLVSFTLYFIPLVFRIWSQLETAWRARMGKRGVKMFIVLLPALFSVGMKSAYTAAKAVMIRSGEVQP